MQAISDPVTWSPAMDETVERAVRGDTEAFEHLYRDHVGRIYALCLRMTGNAAEAEDLTQEAFIRAWERLGSFRGDAAFGTWLHRVAANVVISRGRNIARLRARVVDDEDMTRHADPLDRGPQGTDIDLEGAIASLPDGAREIFVLFDIEGYRHEEIADMTGLAVGTTKAQLHRARKLLREALIQ